MDKLIRIDKNGTKYYESNVCPKCGGTGRLECYNYVEGGVCFLCDGSGRHYHTWMVRTPEYEQKLADRRIKRAKKKAPKVNAKEYERLGLSEEGKCYVVIGNTFNIKDELKEKGAKFNSIGWHFNSPTEEYPTFELSISDIAYKNESDVWVVYADWKIKEIIHDLQLKYAPKTNSEFIGEIGEKISLECVYVGSSSYETNFTYYGEVVNLYKFNSNGNTIIWKTSTEQSFEEGKSYKLKGTVKEHKEYGNNKETVLIRVRVNG